MILISPQKAQIHLAENLKQQRLSLNLTQSGLASRAGVALSTLRKFEQKGEISLSAFLKLNAALGTLVELVKATKPNTVKFSSIDEIIDEKPMRKRGKIT